jgi:N-acetylneuraminic acid mutarotase
MSVPTGSSLRVLTCLSVAVAACTDVPSQPGTTAEALPAAELPSAVSRWIRRANLPGIERDQLTTAVVQRSARQSVLYALGGTVAGTAASLGKVHAYDVAADAWIVRASMPIPVYRTNGAGVIGGKIYVSGGVSGEKIFRRELQVYDPATNTWTLKAPMPDGGTWGGVTGVFRGKLYVLTSISEEDSYIDFSPLLLYRYDPVADQWTRLASSPPQNRRPMGGFMGGKLYVTGAVPSGFGGGALFHAYDPATDQWTPKTPLPHERFDGIGVPVGGRLYVIGGNQMDPDGVVRRVRTTSVYDPGSDRWSEVLPIPVERPGASGSRILRGGIPRIAVVGGTRPGNNLEFTP